MFKLKFIYIYLFFNVCFFANTQTIKFDNYTTKDGLISNEVYKLFQDKKGYIWLFTNYGAMKYNGKKFEPVLKNLPFNESFIYGYYQNSKGELWVANSNSQIYEVRNDSAFVVKKIEKVTEKLRGNFTEVGDFIVDHHDNIYVSTILGLYKFEKAKNYEFSIVKKIPEQDSTYGYLLNVDDRIMFSGRLDLMNKGHVNDKIKYKINFIEEQSSTPLFSIPFSCFNSTKTLPKDFRKINNEIYFSCFNSIYKIKEDKSVKEIPMPSFVLNYLKDSKGHLWVATLNSGLYELNNNDSIINHYFKGKTVNHLLLDSENGLWVSTDGSGIFHCKNLNEIHFIETELQNTYSNFIKKIDNVLFLDKANGIFTVIDRQKTIEIKSITKIAQEILDVIKYNDGYIILYRNNMVFLKIADKVTQTILPQIKPIFIPIKLVQLGKDSILCIGGRRIAFLINGIKSLNDSVKSITLDKKIFTCVARKGIIYFGTNDGVYILSNNKLIQPNYLAKTKGCKVVCITNDVFNNFWFSTKGYGIFKLSNANELKHFTVEDGLPSNIIYDLKFNTDNSILLSTNMGLFQSSKYKKWISICPEEVRTAYGFKNDIYFLSKDGVVINRNIKDVSQQPIYFNISTVHVNGDLVNLQMINKLNYDQNNLEFNFDAISYSSTVPDIIYSLSGKASLIGITKNQQVSLQKLAPGNYTLTVTLTAQNYKSESLSIPFTIIPAFWQTNWFYAIVCCIIIGGCLLSFIYFFNNFKEKERKKSDINRLINEYKLIALKAQINPHFMSNCLTAIQHLIINGKIEKANLYLVKFSVLVRQVLNFSSKSLVKLTEELEIARINIELEQLRFENKFLFEINIIDQENISDIFVPPLILQPIIENAIWHGLLPLKNKAVAKLVIEIFIKDNLLYIIVEDNGVGRLANGDTISNLKDSKGIAITRQRLQNLKEFYNCEYADLVYKDLINEVDQAIGTRVSIILPINLKLEDEN